MYRATVAFLALALAACVAGAQELVTNGTFDVDTSGWELANQVYGDLARVVLDVQNDPSSGSALITNTFPSAAGDLLTTQCIALLPTERQYLISDAIRIADGTVTTGGGYVQIWFWENPDCSTVVGAPIWTDQVTTSDAGWRRNSVNVLAPLAAVAVRLDLWNHKNEAGGALAIHFDDVSMRPIVFADGFELGDTDAWVLPP